MDVFISWSGKRSRAVATALREWLPNVLQTVRPYVSSEDIEKGARWSVDIAQRLDECLFGIVCVTAENASAPWLNFEAGALAKSFVEGRVSPFVLDLSPNEVPEPLRQFQMTLPTLEDVTRLIKTLNAASEPVLPEVQLLRTVELWWPSLEQQLAALPPMPPVDAPEDHDQAALLTELLELARNIQSRVAKLEQRGPDAFDPRPLPRRAWRAAVPTDALKLLSKVAPDVKVTGVQMMTGGGGLLIHLDKDLDIDLARKLDQVLMHADVNEIIFVGPTFSYRATPPNLFSGEREGS